MEAAAASEGEVVLFLQQLLVAARGRELMPRFPVILGVMGSEPGSDSHSQQGVVLVMRGVLSPDGIVDGTPPASKSSIEALQTVEAVEGGEDCPVCLDLLQGGGVSAVKEVPCGHRFHGTCIEKWLGLHGSCPVCRYRMPAEEEGDGKKGEEMGERRGVEREIWVTFGFARRDGDQEATSVTGDQHNRVE